MDSFLRRVAACFAVVPLALLVHSPIAARGANTTPAASTKLTRLDSELAVSPLEARLVDDAADGLWNEYSLFTAAQVASGATTDAELLAAAIDYAALADDLRTNVRPSQSAEGHASAVLTFLHRRLLRGGYDLNATTLPEAFKSGRFNCVSATVLYNCLAAEAGLTVQPLRLPQHTCSLLLDGDRRIRVEATCADWFEKRQRPSAVVDANEPDNGSSDRSQDEGVPISDVALVAMIYYNRGVDALRHNDFKQAITLNRLALSLDPGNSEAQGNLLSAINKRALELATQRRFAAAIELVEQGLKIEPSHSPLRQNRAFIERARQDAANHASGVPL